ncbi:MAG TPA: HigA family addiction module antitoxin [Rhodospirillales bacterium]|jgi:HTH-type transcriptional regulator/antitoxin HigA|nr:HigA family addiction module antitoxin [Rhodospirillales bacterium]
MRDRIPAEVFPPGEFLNDELKERGWTQTEFAEIIGRPPRVVNEVIAGKRSITAATARDIATALGTSAQLWMNLETAYQLSKVPPRDENVAREAALRERFPVREMIKRGWIKATTAREELENSVLAYFQLPDVNAPIQFPHAARRNHGEDLSTVQYAWLFRIRQLASALRLPGFSQQELQAAIPQLERLMTEPEEIRHIPRILSEAGVRLVIVEPIPGSKIQGVCFWLDHNTSPVIGLSLKGDQIDRFWFNLWHEIEHVLRGDGKDGMVIDDFDEVPAPEDERERAANEAAADRCVPTKAMKDFILRHSPMFSEKNMIGFSKIIKRHPGIVAGQIQKRTGRWDLFRKHQVRVRQLIIDDALTDGYGRRVPPNL